MSSRLEREAAPIVRLPKTEVVASGTTVVKAGRHELVVVHSRGRFYALNNRCPHRRAPLACGPVTGTNLASRVGELRYGLEGRVIRCPWHHYEFDMLTGRCLANPDALRVACYAVEDDGEYLTVDVRRRRLLVAGDEARPPCEAAK